MNPERRRTGIDLNLRKLLESMAKRVVGTRNVSGEIRYVIILTNRVSLRPQLPTDNFHVDSLMGCTEFRPGL